jgi:hypothetical protein
MSDRMTVAAEARMAGAAPRPVPGGEQQRVVRRGPEGQHRQDAGALPVDGEHAVLGQQVEDARRDGERQPRADDRQQPQDRAAVDHEQDQDHDGASGDQQGAVERAEDVEQVRRGAAQAGDVGRQPGRPG